ncbi:hypothetical protein HKD37_08G023411 [Glycine soja]
MRGCGLAVFSMRKAFTLQRALLRFSVALLLVASFTCATSVMAITEVSGNEVNTDGKLVNEELAKTSQQGYDKEAKFKGFFSKPIPKPISVVKPIPIPLYKSIPKSIPIVKPIPKSIPNEEEKFKGLFPKPIPIVKPIPKSIPIVKPILKPIPVVKPIPIPVYKSIPKSVPIVKPVPKLIPVVKPITKPIPTFEPESFLKPKPFFEKPVPKLPLEPKFKKPRIPHFPVQKPISTPTP